MNPTETPVFAIVEQMGHRRFGARIREVTRFGAACMEATVLSEPPVVTLVMPASIFAVTFCTEAQARAANLRHTGLPELDAGRHDDPGFDEDDPGFDEDDAGDDVDEKPRAFVALVHMTDAGLERLAAVRAAIAADTSDATEVAVETHDGGFAATAYSGPGRTEADVMACGPWRGCVVDALDELAAEWARGKE